MIRKSNTLKLDKFFIKRVPKTNGEIQPESEEVLPTVKYETRAKELQANFKRTDW